MEWNRFPSYWINVWVKWVDTPSLVAYIQVCLKFMFSYQRHINARFHSHLYPSFEHLPQFMAVIYGSPKQTALFSVTVFLWLPKHSTVLSKTRSYVYNGGLCNLIVTWSEILTHCNLKYYCVAEFIDFKLVITFFFFLVNKCLYFTQDAIAGNHQTAVFRYTKLNKSILAHCITIHRKLVNIFRH